MFNTRQVESFATATLTEEVFEKAVEWIGKNLAPEKVFDKSDLKNWARDQAPEEIFDERDLARWAEANGYVHKAETEEG